MDIELFYTEHGAGRPFVLLHGNGESGAVFAKQIPAFSDRNRVIAVDTRGHGNTPRGRAPFTLSQFADDLKAFFDAHGLEKAHLLGFSDGGNIALIFALRYPERVDRLVLNGANLDPSGLKPVFRIPIACGYALSRLLPGEKARRQTELLDLMARQPHIKPEELRAVEARTLVLVGTRDMIRDRHSQSIADSIPASSLVRIPGDHFIAGNNPAAYNAAVLSFLEAE